MGEQHEYGVARDDEDCELHRGPMSREDAMEWVREWEEAVPDDVPGAHGMFVVVRREVGPWVRDAS